MELREQSSAPQEVEKDLTPDNAPAPAPAEQAEASTASSPVEESSTIVRAPRPEAAPEAPAADAEAPAAEAPAQAPEAAEAPAVEAEAAEAEAPAAETPEEAPAEAPAAAMPQYADKAEVVAALAALAEKDAAEISAEEIARLKHLFYNFRNAEIKAEKAAFVEGGGDEEAFEAPVDADEERFKELLTVVKEKKARMREELEAKREENLHAKQKIIITINEMSSDTDNVNRHFPRVKELQAEFKTIGEVPPTAAAEVWKSYQDAVERFYDQLKINKELRDYDFRKNLAEKQLIVEEAERLAAEDDIITAFRRLQALHDKWREIGPVAKEVREEIWAKFKDASAIINKRYQAHFEERKQRERENEEAKTALCERIEAIDLDQLKSYTAWEEKTKEIMALQEEWKKLGFASKKSNNLLFARFRESCDKFFAGKAEYFKSMKNELIVNLEKKTALCERAEALKDSKDWKKTTDEFIALQKEWKTIGAVAKKHSDAVWRRFLAACDYFFEEKKRCTSGARKAEQANLRAKQELIDALRAIPADAKREDILQQIRDSRTRWQEIGHVPFREKDKIYEQFRQAINELYEKHDIRETRARFQQFENNIESLSGDENKLYRERERLVRALEARRSELKTYENNMGFFNSKSKAGEQMVREMERKMERLREDIADVEKKIEVIDAKL